MDVAKENLIGNYLKRGYCFARHRKDHAGFVGIVGFNDDAPELRTASFGQIKSDL
jgi:hypothetical protein